MTAATPRAGVTVTDEAVHVGARAAFKFHCGEDADLDEANARVPETIYDTELDESVDLDPEDWEPYLTDLWEGWIQAALTAALPRLVEQIGAGIAEAIRAEAKKFDPNEPPLGRGDHQMTLTMQLAANIALAYGMEV